MQGPVILLGSYVCYTTDTLDTIEAFIAEKYVQLAATESKCYSGTSVEYGPLTPKHWPLIIYIKLIFII